MMAPQGLVYSHFSATENDRFRMLPTKKFTGFIDFASATSGRKNGELCELNESYAGQLQANYSNWPPQAKIIYKIYKIYSLHYIKFSGTHHPCGGRERSEQENRILLDVRPM